MKDFTPLQAYTQNCTVDGLRRLSFALLSIFSFALIIKHINREAVLILGIPRHDATADEELRLLFALVVIMTNRGTTRKAIHCLSACILRKP